MKGKVKREEKFDRIETCVGEVKENLSDFADTLSIDSEHFSIAITKRDDFIFISIDPIIHRPNHDHNNSPTIRIKLPAKGLQMDDCPQWGGGKHVEDRTGEIDIQTDSGYLNLDIVLSEYVHDSHRTSFYELVKLLKKNKKEELNVNKTVQ